MSEHCDEALANLYLFMDRELDGNVSDRIRAHLDDCPPCGEQFDFEYRLRVVVKERLSESVPPEMISRIRRAIADECRNA